MNPTLSLLTCLFLSLTCFGQKQINKNKLPSELSELSGLETFNDSILIGINDGGNSPELFFLDLNGSILKRTWVSDAMNTDWEDMTRDTKGYLYIADVGNNSCDRKELCIWKVDLVKAYSSDTVIAEAIRFSYMDHAVPTSSRKGCRFDSEALFWRNDSLSIIIKNTTRPRKNNWDNGTSVYTIPDLPGKYDAKSSIHLWTGGDNRIQHQVTGADLMGDQLCVLTYGNVFFYRCADSAFSLTETKFRFSTLKQRESIVFFDEHTVFIGAERHPLLGGPYLYILKWK